MQVKLLDLLCDPIDKSTLTLTDAVYAADGAIVSGVLTSACGRRYLIRDGIPRFAEVPKLTATVDSFGREWNHFNFDDFHLNWLNHTVKNTFGATDVFHGRLVVDAGGGSGMQSRWMAEAGAGHVVCLELSNSVDGVMRRNLEGISNVDIVQCSIDAPPIKDAVITGMVICHNVIQHTPSVENTALALWRIVAPGGELVFNCYLKNDFNWIRKARFAFYARLRQFLSRRNFRFLLWYSRTVSVLRFVPLLGWAMERLALVIRGNVPKGPHYFGRLYLAGMLNTFDYYGSHAYQHHKTRDEIRSLVRCLQPNAVKVQNLETYLKLPAPPPGCAIRLMK